MKIEEAIHQRKFESEKHKAVVNILYTASWIENHQARVFKLHDLSMQQFNILRILRGQHPKSATVNLLIERMIDKSSNASRIVEKLRSKGLVERTTCSEDRRRVDVKITDEGLKILDAASADLKQRQKEMEVLEEKEAEQLNFLLDKLRSKQQ